MRYRGSLQVAVAALIAILSFAPIQAQSTPPQAPAKDSHLTPQQAKELFASLDQILRFASDDSRLLIEHPVKRKLITRSEVEKYVLDKFHEDKDAQRMQREEIVLKKFGLLDRDFHLQPFLVSLLTEQIAGFYDNKTKTVNLLDWVAPDEQKPVMAHELTHALQDQHTDLEKWTPETPDTPSKDANEDNQRIAVDERDTAHDAALEGQAMAVYVDYTLRPAGRSLATSPDLGDTLKDGASDAGSPVMARAPLLLQESLLFPYRDGLTFEQSLLKDKGAEYAFAGVLDRPPSTSYEIMNPGAYERRQKVPLLRMPDVHELLASAGYDPYDLGVMGQLDVRILSELFGGEQAAGLLTPQWQGGIYYAAQSRNAKTPAEKASTASLGIFYLSAWRTQDAAEQFAKIYREELSKKYSAVHRDAESESSPNEQVFTTGEGPVLIVRQGRQVFVSESFDLTLARKLELIVVGAQEGGELQIASSRTRRAGHELTTPVTGFLGDCGLLKAGLLLH